MGTKTRKKNVRRSTARSRISRCVKKILFERNQKVMQLIQNMSNSDNNSEINANINNSLSSTKTFALRQRLIEWIIEYRIAKRAVNALLSILISNGEHSLPRDYRTLLSTPTNVKITPVAGGSLWYNGIKRSLNVLFENLEENLDISLTFNIDGLPLYKSSKMNFYPILASVFGN